MYVKNAVKSENTTESNVEAEELFEDKKANKPEPEDATHLIKEALYNTLAKMYLRR